MFMTNQQPQSGQIRLQTFSWEKEEHWDLDSSADFMKFSASQSNHISLNKPQKKHFIHFVSQGKSNPLKHKKDSRIIGWFKRKMK